MPQVARWALVAALALACAACGGSKPGPDAAAQAALDRIAAQSGLARIVVAISDRIRQAPALCSIAPDPSAPKRFQLLIGWGQLGEGFRSVERNVVEATIDPAAATPVAYRVTTIAAGQPIPVAVKAELARAALSTSALTCQVLENGRLQLAPTQ